MKNRNEVYEDWLRASFTKACEELNKSYSESSESSDRKFVLHVFGTQEQLEKVECDIDRAILEDLKKFKI